MFRTGVELTFPYLCFRLINQKNWKTYESALNISQPWFLSTKAPVNPVKTLLISQAYLIFN